MPVARPQINKLKRLRQQAHLDATLESGCNAGRLLFGEIKTLLNLLEKSVVQMRSASRDEFFKKQPLLDRELKNLSSFIDTLAAGLANFKSQSIVTKDLLESDNGHFNGINGKTNGNCNTNGSFNGSTNGYINGGTNGNTKGVDATDLVIDPLKWTPEFPTVPYGKPMNCWIAHINDPSDFYVHPFFGSPKFVMEVQQEQIKLIRKGILKLPEIKPKMYCCARFDADTYWYRARIIDIVHRKGKPEEIEKVKVFYLDYGNMAEVTVDDLMPMSISLAKAPVRSINCHLAHYDPEEGWPDEASIVMSNVIGESAVKITFSEDSPRYSEHGSFPYYPVDFCLKSGQNLFEFLRQFINR